MATTVLSRPVSPLPTRLQFSPDKTDYSTTPNYSNTLTPAYHPSSNVSQKENNINSSVIANQLLNRILVNQGSNSSSSLSSPLDTQPSLKQENEYANILSKTLPSFQVMSESLPVLKLPSPSTSPILPILSSVTSNMNMGRTFHEATLSSNPNEVPSADMILKQLANVCTSNNIREFYAESITDVNNGNNEYENGEDEFSKTPYDKLIHRARRVRKCRVVRGKKPRICNWCNTTVTPEWRCGPDHCMLCNACGLQFRNKMKEEARSKKKNAVSNLLN